MDQPIEVDLPHKLGRDEARRRIANNIHKLEQMIPGESVVQSSWAGDELSLAIGALGQSVDAKILVEETLVRVRMLLPPMLGMLAQPIQAMLRSKGGLLLEDRSKD